MYRKDQTSKSTMMRLPLYYRVLSNLARFGETKASSDQLGEILQIDSTQVRRDLSSIGEFGKAGVGYEISAILPVLEDILGYKNTTRSIIVGIGRLGSALFSYSGFERYGMKIVSLFDTDPRKVGTKINGLTVFDISEMTCVVKQLNIHMGIITVPTSSAQFVANVMVEAGIVAIWNFAPIHLRVPDNVIVRYEDLAVGLTHLSRHLASIRNLENPE